RSNDLRSLLNTDAIGLQTSGIAPDSVTRLLSMLQALDRPIATNRLPSSKLGEQGSVFGGFDFTPPSSSSGQSFNISYNGNWNQQTPASQLTSELPAHSGDRTNWNAGLQARHTNYFGVGVLSETSLGLSRSRNYGSPYLDLPSGTVRINSTFPDGTSSIKTVAFGGSSSMNTSQTNTGTELTNQLSWFS